MTRGIFRFFGTRENVRQQNADGANVSARRVTALNPEGTNLPGPGGRYGNEADLTVTGARVDLRSPVDANTAPDIQARTVTVTLDQLGKLQADMDTGKLVAIKTKTAPDLSLIHI